MSRLPGLTSEVAITYQPEAFDEAADLQHRLLNKDIGSTLLNEAEPADICPDAVRERIDTFKRVGARTLLVVTNRLEVGESMAVLPGRQKTDILAASTINRQDGHLYSDRRLRYAPARYGGSAGTIAALGVKPASANYLARLYE